MKKCALICGISGQDGAWLTQNLLRKGYRVIGTSRDASVNNFHNLLKLGIRDQVECVSMTTVDFHNVFEVIATTKPDEIYNLSGQSSVGMSFSQPVDTLNSILQSTLHLLEAIRILNRDIRFVNAASSECFGNTSSRGADEQTAFHPCSPYAVAKAAAFWLVVNYRQSYGLHCSNSIMFNHESHLRPMRFVTRKIIATAVAIANGSKTRLKLGNLNVERDWGFAPEYMEAMRLMGQADRPTDLVIATGQSHTLQEFVEMVFSTLQLDWRQWVDIDSSHHRPTDLVCSRANPEKAATEIGWNATTHFDDLILKLVDKEVSLA